MLYSHITKNLIVLQDIILKNVAKKSKFFENFSYRIHQTVIF